MPKEPEEEESVSDSEIPEDVRENFQKTRRALKTLKSEAYGELKSMQNPANTLVKITCAVMILFGYDHADWITCRSIFNATKIKKANTRIRSP
eukprot:UN03172